MIELLVVIAIIGILATVSVVALNNARAKSRDAKRVADVKNIQTALALYYNDKKEYPITLIAGQPLFSTSLDGSGNVVTSTYISSIPSAPTPADGSNCNTANNAFTYVTSSDLQYYTLSTCVSSPPQTQASSSGAAIYISDPAQTQPCGQYMIDYEGQKYRTVQIGTQCWMRDNLNVGTMVTSYGAAPCSEPVTGRWGCQLDDALLEKYCYSNSAANCLSYGGLYEWQEAMNLGVACRNTDCSAQVQTPHKGICPSGWHIPTITEFNTLATFLDTTIAGTQMKIGGTSNFDGALVGMRRDDGGGFLYLNTQVWYITATQNGNYTFNSKSLQSGSATLIQAYHDYGKSHGYAMRCLKN